MKNQRFLLATGLILGGLALGGCAKDAAPGTSPGGVTSGSTPATKPVAVPAMTDKEMTHVIPQETPYYNSMPTGSAKPAGMMKGGTKVLLLVPGDYAQVETMDGKMFYVKRESIELMSAAPAVRPQGGTATPTPAKPVAKVAEKAVEKTMTHVVSKDQPYYDSMPSTGGKSSGMLAKGTKVLLVIPNTPYCQVETADGKTVYTETEGVDLIK